MLNSKTVLITGGTGSFGNYFTEYPVMVTALPAEGYRFAGWQGTYESAEETIEAAVTREGICLRAVFVPEKTQ